MRKSVFGAWALLVVTLFAAAAAQDRPLADIYKSGRVRLIEEVRVADAALPADALFQNPRGLAVDTQGLVYVADYDANHIKVFSSDGKFIKTIGRQGEGPGEFQGPEFIEIGGGRIYVWEAMNRRISILDSEGRSLGTTPFSPGAFGVFIKMRALPDGRLVAYYERGLVEGAQSRIPDSQERVVELLSAEAKPIRILYEKNVRASRLAWNADYEAYVRVPFPYHPGIVMDVVPSGEVAAGMNDKYEFEILDPDKGRQRTFSRPWTPVKVVDEDKQKHFSQFKMVVFKDNVKTVLPKAPDHILKNTEFPKTFPAYRSLITDSEGNILVQLYTESREFNVFDVFDPRTGFIARITFEGAPLDSSFAVSASHRFSGSTL
jgi:hypothetical protein